MKEFDDETEEKVVELRVLFIGDKPSKHNLFFNQAFTGSRSGVTLNKWVERMGIALDAYMTINRTDEFFLDCVKSFIRQGKPIVSLGNNADNALNSAKIHHYRLPHPSGLNRKNNDSALLNVSLEGCKRYILALEEFKKG